MIENTLFWYDYALNAILDKYHNKKKKNVCTIKCLNEFSRQIGNRMLWRFILWDIWS